MKTNKLELTLWLLLFLVASILTLSHARLGSLVSMDSLSYFSAAVSLAHGNGLFIPHYENFESSFIPMTMWPPLYSSLLSLFCILGECNGIDIEKYAIWLNLVMLFISLIAIYFIVWKRTSNWIAMTVVSMFLLLPGIQIIFMYAWSEVVFIPLIMISFVCLDCFLRKESNKHMLFLAVFFAITATYTRYIGVAYTLALLLSIVLFAEGVLVKRMVLAFASGTFFSIGILPLLFRNFYYTGFISGGERGLPEFRFFDDIKTLLSLINIEFFSSYNYWAFITLIILIIAVTLLAYKKGIELLTSRLFKLNVYLPLIWFFVYIGFLLISRTTQVIDLDARMLAVAWPFLLMSLAGFFSISRQHGVYKFALTGCILFMAAILYSGARVHNQILVNLQQTNEAGWINKFYYPSITGSQFDIIRKISHNFQLNSSDLLVTDLRRPIILYYFFSKPLIKTLPKKETDGQRINYVQLENISGLLLLSAKKNIVQLLSDYDGKVKIYGFSTQLGEIKYVAVKLPLPIGN